MVGNIKLLCGVYLWKIFSHQWRDQDKILAHVTLLIKGHAGNTEAAPPRDLVLQHDQNLLRYLEYIIRTNVFNNTN